MPENKPRKEVVEIHKTAENKLRRITAASKQNHRWEKQVINAHYSPMVAMPDMTRIGDEALVYQR